MIRCRPASYFAGPSVEGGFDICASDRTAIPNGACMRVDELGPAGMMVQSADCVGDDKLRQLANEAAQLLWPKRTVLLRLWNPVVWTEHDGQPSGLLLYSPVSDAGFVWVDLVYVRPDIRRRAICMTLLRHLLGVVSGYGASTIACSVHANNYTMVKAVQLLGFQLEPDDGPYLLASRAIRG